MGRFLFVSHRDGDRTVFKANPNYWNKSAPPIGGLEIWESTEDNARTNAVLANNSFDMTFSRGLTTDQWKSNGFDVVEKPSTVSYFLQLKTAGPLADTRVRQAIAMGIDKKALVGLAFPTGGCDPADQAYPSNVFGASPNIQLGSVPYDTGKARSLLKDAGQTSLSLTLETQSRGAYVSLAEVIQQDLKKIGVSTSITQSAFAEGRKKFQAGGTDMLVTIQFASADPSQDIALYALADSPWNPGHYAPAGLADTASKALASTDVKQRSDLYAKATQLLTTEATPYIPLCNGTTSVVYRAKQLGGLQLFPDGVYRWDSVYKRKS
jgi:peptide/nickel transport system substrate-binding protein